MKKNQQPEKNERFIRIDAQSEIYSIREDVPESKCVPRLIKIRTLFQNENARRFANATLKVKTWVLNPELPFASQR